ncbi:MAG: NAD(P)H-dependent oxidoreductase [Gemmatimonadetes bacterium]|uniref:NAD(P)H-dependent oxidoreductase n=1 Tax=Candidatus Kutchimonas denitrificans TaxID=3056748 RepID=A0AAE5CCH7_9BACT|nr:NAD(P)H-dependent oxidoreductase [Gemmatimonadota bacterium]NIR75948.1 NAD(P)H-dependent oxidoreductase [Candidatus Kutchimonas denitrificans]NIS02106.1 NAD(P)H-dependent oxidoreductase [Gemmatimonadota bacterium]NIT67931.1 NAD(P)H-dependent oxidoreductase [Gemmatimonadota bacterium]NIU53925.1 NADPH-dependent oxidoreductase [Gemmatimonadota bacterium]
MTEERNIRVVAVLGTVRPGSYTSKALALVADEFGKYEDVTLEVVDPAELELPLPGRGASEDAERLREKVSNATGLVLSTPEYHGGYSATIKLVIENLGFPSALSGKPVALLGVAAGQIGAIKSLESLRSVCSHVGAIVLPGPVSVARVREAFEEDGTVTDEVVEKRVRGVATNLLDYIERHICPAITLEAMVREDAA